MDGDGFSDVLAGAPFASGSELTIENGYAALFRGSAGGLIPTPIRRRPCACAEPVVGADWPAMKEITFNVEPCAETGGYVARWDDAPGKGGITTQGDTFAELDAMIADAVKGFFDSAERPERVRLHFVEDPVVALA